mmetsp:Transcript_22652/g.89618  ORF Transcript_22652/g.89618 Transcript_22652/m.89618 type:complete len:207 (+) Transcript_22652:3029-3649(+)
MTERSQLRAREHHQPRCEGGHKVLVVEDGGLAGEDEEVPELAVVLRMKGACLGGAARLQGIVSSALKVSVCVESLHENSEVCRLERVLRDHTQAAARKDDEVDELCRGKGRLLLVPLHPLTDCLLRLASLDHLMKLMALSNGRLRRTRALLGCRPLHLRVLGELRDPGEDVGRRLLLLLLTELILRASTDRLLVLLLLISSRSAHH